MVAAKRMSSEQITELIELARADKQLWATLKEREREGELRLLGQMTEEIKLPSMAMLVEDLVCRKYGANHPFQFGDLILKIRYFARIELGFPVE